MKRPVATTSLLLFEQPRDRFRTKETAAADDFGIQ